MKKFIRAITTKEWEFVVLMIILFILVINLPFIYAFITAPKGFFYNGLRTLTPGDLIIYYSYINQIKDGYFTILNEFTTELQTHSEFNIFWLTVGLAARFFKLNAIIALQLFRTLFVIPAIVAVYIFVSYFFKEQVLRKTGLIFILFASGLGIILDFLAKENINDDYLPIDQWVPESTTFTTLYHLPHLTAALILIVMIYYFMLKAAEKDSWKYALVAGLGGLVLFNFHPYHFITINSVIFSYYAILAIKKELNIKKATLYFLIWFFASVPFVVYRYILMKTDEVIGITAKQNVCLTPPFIYVLTGYGFLLIFACLGAYYYFKNKQKDNKILFLLLWAFINLLLIYAPIQFQRRMIQGLHIPLCLLTVYALQYFKNGLYFKINKVKFHILLILFLMFFITPLFVVARDIICFQYKIAAFYISDDEIKAISWLENKNWNDKIIVTNPEDFSISRYRWISVFSRQKVYITHQHATLYYDYKMNFLKKIFQENNRLELYKFFKLNNIGYIYLLKNQEYEKTSNFFQKNFTKVYENPSIIIYEIY